METPTAILYGSGDNLSEWEEISAFALRYQAAVKILDNGEHYFHTEQQLHELDTWADEELLF
jgi:predicted alpha/beta-hydrolase family hydrolase